MKSILLFCMAFTSTTVFAQKETFDLISYNPPANWKKDVTENSTCYTITNKKTYSWCRINILKSTSSKGNIEHDFESEWQELVVKNYTPTGAPQLNDLPENDGWKIKSGEAKFVFNNSDAMVLLTTASGYERCVSVVAITNSQDYMKDIEALLASVDLVKPKTNELQTPVANNNKNSVTNTTSIAKNDGFAFTTTNFDDGWTSTVQEDWVQVTKGNTKVLLHYPTNKINAANTDIDVMCAAAWNVLVAPRYSHIENYQVTPSVIDYQRPYFAQANLTDNLTGKKVFIALFKKGNSGWIEIITADKNSFIKDFGLDISKIDYYADSKIWEPLLQLSNYNKFAVAASDLKGKWTTNFSGMTQYVNIYTGADAGATAHSSHQVFEFEAGNTYKWSIAVASGIIGNMKFNGAKSNGRFSLPNNWQLHFSDIEGKPKTYNVFFTCIKAARILWIDDAGYGKKE